ncbi:MAG: DUF3237 domain-containing protein [Acidimicrobiales bacterium]
MDLEFEFAFVAENGQLLRVGKGPSGTRIVAPITGGPVTGARVHGTLAPGSGADWLLIGADGSVRLDVRFQIVTDDGAFIYVSYPGVVQPTDKLKAAMMSPDTAWPEETSYDDQYFRATPRLETGDERYAWVSQTVFVARGRLASNGVGFEVYRVT